MYLVAPRHVPLFLSTILFVFASYFPLTPGPAMAQSDLILKIKERAKARDEIIELIKSSTEPGLRLAAFEEAVRSDDPELRLSAMGVAFSSNDKRLRKAALRHFLNDRPELRLEFLLPDNADKAQQLLFDQHQALRFMKIKVDPRTDIITFDKYKNQFWSGHLIDDGIDLTFKRPRGSGETLRCILKLRIASASLMTGQLDCVIKARRMLKKSGGKNRGVLPVKVSLS